MKKIIPLSTACFFFISFTQAQVTIQVNAAQGQKPISPYIYGKNNTISDDAGSPTSATEWQFMRDAGLRFTRENGGNNGSRYNWRKKITCHPDWYNNVYAHNWDYAAQTFLDSLPGAQGMWGFQLIGRAASNTNNNFDDWNYNGSSWWSGVQQNLAGGGVPDGAGGSQATTDGDINLYTESWTADSTVGILDHWFGTGGLGYDENKLQYWSMDNEPDIWYDTHDDVMPTQPTAEAFMQLYFDVAKKARAKFPNIKLCGPIPASEWQWYTWNNTKVTGADAIEYNWIEYFIKRCAEEQTSSGIRLLDVIDLHSYPNESNTSDVLNLHRIYFDTTYSYPGANGVKTTDVSGWNNSITQEFIFERCNRWLNQYMGPNHGVTCGVSEYGFQHINASVSAVSYASVLGTFADNGVEYFSPWYWNTGMWETMHLFSRYAKTTRVLSTSTNENNVSAYSSINTAGDSMTVILINRAQSGSSATTINLNNFSVADGSYNTLQLSSLPSSETFVSHNNNALQSGSITFSGNSASISLPALSITAIILKSAGSTGINQTAYNNFETKIYPNPSNTSLTIDAGASNIISGIKIYNILGSLVMENKSVNQNKTTITTENLQAAVYLLEITCNEGTYFTRFTKE